MARPTSNAAWRHWPYGDHHEPFCADHALDHPRAPGDERPAPRKPRHPLPAAGGGLGDAAAAQCAAAVGDGAGGRMPAVARLAGLAYTPPARALVAAGHAAGSHRRHPADPQDRAGAGCRRHPYHPAAGAQDARAAGAARCFRHLLPGLLHDAHELLLFAVTADGRLHGGRAAGPAHRTGERPQTGGQTTAARVRAYGRHHGAAGCAHRGRAVHLLPAAGAAVGHTIRQLHGPHRTVVHHAGGQCGAAGAGRYGSHAHPLCQRRGASAPASLLPGTCAGQFRRARVEVPLHPARRYVAHPAAG